MLEPRVALSKPSDPFRAGPDGAPRNGLRCSHHGSPGPACRAVHALDELALRRCLRDDVFVFTPEADGVLTSGQAVIEHATRHFERLREIGATIRIREVASVAGESPSGRAAWVFDQLVVEVVGDGVAASTTVRVTALLVRDVHEEWQVAAAYWSLPYSSQAEQDAVKHAGDLEPGVIREHALTEPSRSFVGPLVTTLRRPELLPDLYST